MHLVSLCSPVCFFASKKAFDTAPFVALQGEPGPHGPPGGPGEDGERVRHSLASDLLPQPDRRSSLTCGTLYRRLTEKI